MAYDEKLQKLNNDEFFEFFSQVGAQPRWVNSAGHQSLQIIGLCHDGQSHSALFDPTTLKVSCFSLCGGSMLFHTWVKRALHLDNPQEAKDYFEDWVDGKDIDLSSRVSRGLEDFVYQERPFVVENIPPIEGIGDFAKTQLYSEFDTSLETLSRLVWHTKDGINEHILQEFDVAYFPRRKTIILPHHNINGEIVGIYERSFLPLRKEMKERYPEAEYKWLCQFPRAKYVPLLKEGDFVREDDNKTSWSFPNNQNLYGLHKAKDAIKETGKAIIFEGAKSVMLAHQYGYPYAVASHTFGANVNHISMLINCGAKEIIFAFDKQYEVVDEEDKQWRLYEKKTRELAEKVGKAVNVSRIVDFYGEQSPVLGYKDAPIDCGKETFDKLFSQREPLIIDGVSQTERKRLELRTERQRILEKIRRAKVDHSDDGTIETDGHIQMF